jgi:predicted permease
MSRTDFARTFRQPLLYAAAAVKLALVPALAVLLLLPFGLPPLIFSTCVILAATPTAGATGMFAQRFGQDTAAAAQLITLSTLSP